MRFATTLIAWSLLAATTTAADRPAPLAKNRVLFNGDCTFLFGDAYMPDPKAPYTKDVLHRFIDLIADGGVDTYLCNNISQMPWYPSKRTPHVLTGYKRGDRDFFRGHYRVGLAKDRLEKALDGDVLFLNRYLDLAEAGVNWIDEVNKACRRRGIAPWMSVRMNDMHGANSWEKSYMNCPLQRDPKYRLSGKQINPKDANNRMEQALDYSHKEVRDYMLLVIREALEDHDYEGVELDWLRCPYCIDPPATQAAIDLMTQWTAEVRKLTEAKAKKIGKPVPLGVRIPIRLGQLREVGLDVKAWCAAGLIDFVNPSNFWQTSWDVPYDELRRELGPKVAIYGVIEDAPNGMEALDPTTGKKSFRLLSASNELLRGNAAGKLVHGVHGIETFNFFCTDEPDHNPLWNKGQTKYATLHELRDLDKLRGKPKHYTLACANGPYQFPLWEYCEQLPVLIEPGGKKAFRVSMCREPENTELVVQVVVEKSDAAPEIGVSVNGSYPRFDGKPTDRLVFPTGIYTHHVPANRAVEVRIPASAIREGWNEVLVFNGSKKKAGERRENVLKVMSLELAVVAK